MGGSALEAYDGWFRFAGIALDHDATPGDAFIFLGMLSPNTNYRGAGGLPLTIYGIDEDDHAAPTTSAEWNTDHGIHTTALTTLLMPGGGEESSIRDMSGLFTENISSIVQEITARVNFISGYDMGFHFDYDYSIDPGWAQYWICNDGGHTVRRPVLCIAEGTEIWPRPIGQAWATDVAVQSITCPIEYPPDMLVGEVIYCVVGVDAGKTVTWPAGWTEIAEKTDATTAVTLSVGAHDVSGAEAERFTLTLSALTTWTTITFRVTRSAPLSTAPEAATASGADTAPNPPSVSPSASKKWMVMAVMANDGGGVPTAYPAGYLCQMFSPAGVGVAVAFAWVESGDAIDPAAFTIASDQWAAATILVPPVASLPTYYRATQGGVWGVAG